MTIVQDERFKAFAHGLLFGCALPIFGYNVSNRRRRNVIIYSAFLLFEVWNFYQHCVACNEETQ